MPHCGFQGDPDQIEQLSRLDWLLREIDTWVDLGFYTNTPKRLHRHYINRRQEIRSVLGLNYVPFESSEIEAAAIELRQHERLFEEITKWLTAGYLKTGFLPSYYGPCALNLQSGEMV